MKNMKIGVRLGIGFCIILMLMVLMLGISIWQMQKIDTSVTLMTTESLNDERDANEWLAVIRESGIRTLAIINLDDAKM